VAQLWRSGSPSQSPRRPCRRATGEQPRRRRRVAPHAALCLPPVTLSPGACGGASLANGGARAAAGGRSRPLCRAGPAVSPPPRVEPGPFRRSTQLGVGRDASYRRQAGVLVLAGAPRSANLQAESSSALGRNRPSRRRARPRARSSAEAAQTGDSSASPDSRIQERAAMRSAPLERALRQCRRPRSSTQRPAGRPPGVDARSKSSQVNDPLEQLVWDRPASGR